MKIKYPFLYSHYKLTKLFDKHCSCELLILKDSVEALTEVNVHNYCVLTGLIWPTCEVNLVFCFISCLIWTTCKVFCFISCFSLQTSTSCCDGEKSHGRELKSSNNVHRSRPYPCFIWNIYYVNCFAGDWFNQCLVPGND